MPLIKPAANNEIYKRQRDTVPSRPPASGKSQQINQFENAGGNRHNSLSLNAVVNYAYKQKPRQEKL